MRIIWSFQVANAGAAAGVARPVCILKADSVHAVFRDDNEHGGGRRPQNHPEQRLVEWEGEQVLHKTVVELEAGPVWNQGPVECWGRDQEEHLWVKRALDRVSPAAGTNSRAFAKTRLPLKDNLLQVPDYPSQHIKNQLLFQKVQRHLAQSHLLKQERPAGGVPPKPAHTEVAQQSLQCHQY